MKKTTKKETTKKYKVKLPFKSDINDKVVNARPGDIVELNDFQFSVLHRFLEV